MMFHPFTPQNWGFVPQGSVQKKRVITPRVRSHVANDRIVLELEVPGTREDLVEIELQGQELLIRAERASFELPEEARPLMRERFSGNYERQFELPWEVEEDSVEATLKQGILKLTLLRSRDSRPRKIQVKAG
jgi:HSP20 family protein